jgi:serine/threonine protein kinase
MGSCLDCVMSFFRQSKIHKISGRKLREIKQIAEGGYGYVILVEDTETRKNYAMKKLICQSE